MIEMTAHGKERVFERANLEGEKALNFITRAYNKGKTCEECSPQIRKYINNISKQSNGNCVKIWSNKVFIFAGDLLITMYDLPKVLVKNNHPKVKYYCA